MRIEAITLIGARRFDVEFPDVRRLGIRHWLCVQFIGLVVMLAGSISVTSLQSEKD